MTNEYHSPGKTTLAPDVILTISRQSALEVEGVQGLARVRGGMKGMYGRANDGVRLRIENNVVFVDIFLVLENEVNIREVSRKVQLTVARAITEMTGLEAGHINVHIEDIHIKAES